MATYQADYFLQIYLKIPGVAVTGNTQTEFTFEDQPDLRFARLLSVETYFQEDLTHSAPEPVPVIPGNMASKITLRLQTNDPDRHPTAGGDADNYTGALDTIRWWPLTAFHLIQNNVAVSAGFVRDRVYWKNRYVIWQKSGIRIAPGGLGNTTDVAVVLGVHYTWMTIRDKIIDKRS